MPFLTIGTQAGLQVVRFRRLKSERGGGGLRRAIGGQLRGDVQWSARNWQADILCTTDAQADALYAYADTAADVAVSGDATGGAVTARVEEDGDEYEMMDNSGTWHRVISLLIREQVV